VGIGALWNYLAILRMLLNRSAERVHPELC
jgi:hypothetical protein